MMTISQAHTQWEETIKPLVVEKYGEDDETALAESWSNYTDQLCKDGELSPLQYHYCPDHTGDDILADGDDEEGERDWMLEDCLDLSLDLSPISARETGNTDWPADAQHYRFTIRRGGNYSITGEYSQGSAHTDQPTLAEILACVVSDARSATGALDFDDWAAEFGLICDCCGQPTRGAQDVYEACEAYEADLAAMFNSEEREELDRLLSEL